MTRMKTSLKDRTIKTEDAVSTTQPDLCDLHGVTPLMHAAALGHTETVQVMMEYNRSGTVTIDMGARDDNGNTALDHAVRLGNSATNSHNSSPNKSLKNNHNNNNNNNNINSSINKGPGVSNNNNNKNKVGKTLTTSPSAAVSAVQRSKSVEIQGLLQSYSSEVGAVRCPSPSPPGTGEEMIELADMSSHQSQGSDPAHQPRQPRALHASLRKNDRQGQSSRHHSSKSESDSGDSVGCDSGDIQKWAEEVKGQHEAAGRMATLASPSVPSLSRPGSKQSQVKQSRPGSSLSAPGYVPVARPGSPRVKAIGQTRRQDLLRPSGTSDEDDDEDISLQSLSDLLGTVRQYAKEIREIYAPIQKEEEERVKKKHERAEKRRNKVLNKALDAARAKKNLGPPVQQEVCVEIHQLEDAAGRVEGGAGREKHKPRGPSHSKSMEPSPSQPVALLHVENEQLSSTWPRGRPRSQSSDRTLAETSGRKRVTTSFKETSSTSGHARPQIPADWHEQGTLQHERDILNKAFKRLNDKQPDMLMSAFNKTQSPGHRRMPQQMVQNSRQSVIQVAKEHQMARQNALPSISIIPPPAEVQRGMVPGGGGSSLYDNAVIIPPGDSVASEGHHHIEKQSKNGGAGVKSSAKAGLRRRKSVDQGMGPNVVMDKY
ncbi:LIM domain-containing protein A [Aplysia californica]|uniref:LIM domain-containing protein A n=1 Tax=Aplysia californica TaxID=6500 RepID=A0ABM0JV42_APLCA|nr:LIM domain-containing protein A [Aplysia californica]